jgi:hypothetical protein
MIDNHNWSTMDLLRSNSVNNGFGKIVGSTIRSTMVLVNNGFGKIVGSIGGGRDHWFRTRGYNVYLFVWLRLHKSINHYVSVAVAVAISTATAVAVAAAVAQSSSSSNRSSCLEG